MKSQTQREEEDAEANLFAMYLLMPENFVRQEVQKMGGVDLTNDKHIQELAKKFQVPVAAMAIRLGQIYGVKG